MSASRSLVPSASQAPETRGAGVRPGLRRLVRRGGGVSLALVAAALLLASPSVGAAILAALSETWRALGSFAR